MTGPDSSCPTRFRLGVLHGIGVATLFSAYVLIVVAAGGRAHIELGVSVRTVVAGYFVAGVVGGLIYGALAPLTKWWIGRALVGFLIMFPIGLGVMTVLPDAPLDDFGTWIDVVIFAGLLGGLGGQHFLEPGPSGSTNAGGARSS